MKAKKQRATIKVAGRRTAPDKGPSLGTPIPKNTKLDLFTLLAETPEQCIDSTWENCSPVGREFR